MDGSLDYLEMRVQYTALIAYERVENSSISNTASGMTGVDAGDNGKIGRYHGPFLVSYALYGHYVNAVEIDRAPRKEYQLFPESKGKVEERLNHVIR